ncbi:hypothetical protein GobsT_41220 [Gemmata obscuriglobus]|uniref:Protein BatD n=1 Tax=Gemmata obscuriglobus TaxID=114 RepID=A0A2Z3GVU2_9BACT|nr:hypothetical protein [Gemmata obscuriglobus]AWM37843.1 hypothetical protein C1280_13115 [Gemmata obscuriglobus]QEG29326.1 hypothetical protein GobsT_41220 [Gemmata obscuriglobus]VTS08325.1 Uncharacterized protein OS=Isosphaera pallida (strain ATCC 43644 / DSM 9630 / IS1B) GN=Isop_3569 PE=4 SV=1 [Gemmata obscuriglobus UQM 2246]
MTHRRPAELFRTAALACVLALLAPADRARAQTETTVGMTGTLEGLVLPGSELEAAPLTDRTAKAVVRVVRVFPHGTAFRYDIEYFGLEPGTHDLRQYLKRKDGSPLGELPPIAVQVKPVLPPGQVQPNKLEIDTGSRLGGYRFLAIGAVVVWALGLIAVVASFFFPRRKRAVADADRRPVSLAERLRPLVEGATAGTLSRAQLADLERALLAYWRKRLKLEGAEPGEAIEAMRKQPDAAPLLAQLEVWLHRPGPVQPVDVAALLAPYRDLPPEALDLEVRGAA